MEVVAPGVARGVEPEDRAVGPVVAGFEECVRPLPWMIPARIIDVDADPIAVVADQFDLFTAIRA